MSDIVIQVENLSKYYRLGLVGTTTLEDDLHRAWAKLRGKPDPTLKIGQEDKNNGDGYIWALKDISFEVKQGETLGIIGRNGSGKSTLLKILSRVTAPTIGECRVKGRIASLLEVGTGFHPELTGRENIFLNGAILGMTKDEIRSKFDEIVAFAEVEKFIDTPVKRYSSGMYVRLAFAVAAHLEPEILVVDEVLAVGDVAFQKKCLGKLGDVAKEGRTVLFVSHNMAAIQNLCPKCILLNNGHILKMGGTVDIIHHYLNMGENIVDNSCFKRNVLNKKLYFTDINLYDTAGKIKCKFMSGKDILIKIHYKLNVKLANAQIAFELFNQDGICILCSTNFDLDIEKRGAIHDAGKYIARCLLNTDFLRDGIYYVTISSSIPRVEILDEIQFAIKFEIKTPLNITNVLSQGRRGIIFKKLKWQTENQIKAIEVN
jgi:lipopolysaccharide transport system ATP-binding protein